METFDTLCLLSAGAQARTHCWRRKIDDNTASRHSDNQPREEMRDSVGHSFTSEAQ